MAQLLNGKPHGILRRSGRNWVFKTSSLVGRRLKRLFTGVKDANGLLVIPSNLDTDEDILWILDRFAHDTDPEEMTMLRRLVLARRDAEEQAVEILSNHDLPQPADLAIPLRPYQVQGVEYAHLVRGLLIGDDTGLGKTATAIGVMVAQEARPALVVCQAHLPKQWMGQINLFAPSLKVHIIKQRGAYPLPPCDVYICSYSKLSAWWDRHPWKAVIYDEAQELRAGADTDKGRAARNLGGVTDYRIGLTATPVYNYAKEMFHVMNMLSPGVLGTEQEFMGEWGKEADHRGKLPNPEALGQWLRSQRVYLRRTRADVGKERPALHQVSHLVEYSPTIMKELTGNALNLARKVLGGTFQEKGEASRLLDIMLRQATGVAKASFVAQFVIDLVEAGEPVLLGGWHREVFSVWRQAFDKAGIPHVLYSGSESPGQKAEAVRKFTTGEAKVLVLSLRSGAGLDGLQHVCKTVVYGELDWSPRVMQQFHDRVDRDGQKERVTAFYLVSDNGSDPIVAGILGVKDAQGIAITDPDKLGQLPPEVDEETRIAKLAKNWIANHGRHS